MRKVFAILIVLIYSARTEAQTQISGSVSLVSDYLYRGTSLSNGEAVPQLNLTYDNLAGWYFGTFLSEVRLAENGSRGEQLITYTGYSRRLQSGSVWEVGVVKSFFPKTENLNYTEVFVGLASDGISGKIYFSPDYLGQNIDTVYTELNNAYQIFERLKIFGHIGFLKSLPGTHRFSEISRFDSQIGVGASLANWEFQLAWDAAGKNRASNSLYATVRSSFVLSARHTF